MPDMRGVPAPPQAVVEAADTPLAYANTLTTAKALALTGEVADGFILQLADLSIAEWTIGAVRQAAAAAGRDPDDITICVAAPAYVTDGTEAGLAHGREQCRWFGGMVGNHVADIVARYGDDAPVPKALTDYIAGRQGYDYNEHGQAGNSHTSFVPDEMTARAAPAAAAASTRAASRSRVCSSSSPSSMARRGTSTPTLRARGRRSATRTSRMTQSRSSIRTPMG